MAGLFHDGIFDAKKNKIYSNIAEKDLVKKTTGLGSEDSETDSSAASLISNFALCLVAIIYLH